MISITELFKNVVLGRISSAQAALWQLRLTHTLLRSLVGTLSHVFAEGANHVSLHTCICLLLKKRIMHRSVLLDAEFDLTTRVVIAVIHNTTFIDTPQYRRTLPLVQTLVVFLGSTTTAPSERAIVIIVAGA